MSYVVDGENYRGGYASSGRISPEDERIAMAYENYVRGTVLFVLIFFATLLFLSGLTFFLMCYTRYRNTRQHKHGFYNPPPRIMRYPKKQSNGTYSTMTRSTRSDYETLPRQINSRMSTAASQQSEML